MQTTSPNDTGGRWKDTAASASATISAQLSVLPRLPQPVLERSRLHDMLDSGVPLVVVHAPIGFGKTTLVACWAGAAGDRAGTIVWLNAYRARDADSFWSGAVGAFAASGIILPDGRTAFSRLTAGLLRRRTPVVLVIDDFDATADPDLENDLLALVKHHRSLRVIVCMRGSHSFSGRADLETVVITARDLALTKKETRLLLRASGARSDARFAALVHESTLGWPEPTHALALGLDEHADTEQLTKTAYQVSRDYLHRRMLPCFEGADWLDFAFASAVPEHISAALAEHLSPGMGSAERLRRMEVEGLLHGEDDGGTHCYRWPQAARTALLEEFARQDATRLASLRNRLAAWHLDHGAAVQALRNAAAAENWQLLTHIVETHWSPILHAADPDLDDALAGIPHAVLVSSPITVALRDIRLHVTASQDDLLLSLPNTLPTEAAELIELGRSGRARSAFGTAEMMMIALRLRGRMRAAIAFARATEVIMSPPSSTGSETSPRSCRPHCSRSVSPDCLPTIWTGQSVCCAALIGPQRPDAVPPTTSRPTPSARSRWSTRSRGTRTRRIAGWHGRRAHRSRPGGWRHVWR